MIQKITTFVFRFLTKYDIRYDKPAVQVMIHVLS